MFKQGQCVPSFQLGCSITTGRRRRRKELPPRSRHATHHLSLLLPTPTLSLSSTLSFFTFTFSEVPACNRSPLSPSTSTPPHFHFVQRFHFHFLQHFLMQPITSLSFYPHSPTLSLSSALSLFHFHLHATHHLSLLLPTPTLSLSLTLSLFLFHLPLTTGKLVVLAQRENVPDFYHSKYTDPTSTTLSFLFYFVLPLTPPQYFSRKNSFFLISHFLSNTLSRPHFQSHLRAKAS